MSTTDCVNLTDRNLRDPSQIRSERQLPYLSLVHYLAERAGLVDLEGEWLKPTLAAQSWLAQSRAGRLRTLWEAWREDSEANAELWSRFGLPGDSDLSPLTRFNRLLACLASLSPGDYPLDDLLEALVRRDPALLQPCAPYRIWAEMDERTRADFRQRARRWVAEMLSGPLAWFGATSFLDPSPGPSPTRGGEGISHKGRFFLAAGERWGKWASGVPNLFGAASPECENRPQQVGDSPPCKKPTLEREGISPFPRREGGRGVRSNTV